MSAASVNSNEGSLEMIAAEYTNGTSRIAPMLWITKIENGRREYVNGYPVTGKREARKLAQTLNAQPWNF